MSAVTGKKQFRRRVAVGAGGVLVTTMASLLWMGVPSGEAGEWSRPVPRLIIAGHGEGKLPPSETKLRDPSPLFFPTAWNYGQTGAGAGGKREPDEGFQNYIPQFRFSDQRLANYGREAVVVPERLADVVEQGVTHPFAGFGELGYQADPLPERGGYLEVKALGNGRLILAAELPSMGVSVGEHAPIEFLVTIGPAGMVGGALFAASSGSETIDGQVRDFVLQTYRLGERLGPGKYLVTVGP